MGGCLKKVKKTSRNKYFLKECFNKKVSLELRGRMSKILDTFEGSRKKRPFCWWQQLKRNLSTVFLHGKIPRVPLAIKTDTRKVTISVWFSLCDSWFSLPQTVPSLAAFLTLLFSYHKTDHSSPFSILFSLSLCGVCVCWGCGGCVCVCACECMNTCTHFNKITNLSLWESLFPTPRRDS